MNIMVQILCCDNFIVVKKLKCLFSSVNFVDEYIFSVKYTDTSMAIPTIADVGGDGFSNSVCQKYVCSSV